jgi:hypothetical protein
MTRGSNDEIQYTNIKGQPLIRKSMTARTATSCPQAHQILVESLT